MLEVAIQTRFEGFQLDAAFTIGKELAVLFGPSGAGKSLTLQSIAGTIMPNAGRIRVDGETMYDSATRLLLPPQARRVGYVPQHYALFPHLSAAENIGFGLRGRPRLTRDERTRRVAEMLDLFALHGLAQRRPHELSGGQRQRVALARALAIQPHLLLLDEPFAALDAPLRGTLRRELVDLQARWGITVLLVTHDLADAFALGRQVIVYDRGQVIQQGPRDDVFFRPATRRVAEFVGTGNILPAVAEQREANTLWVRWQHYRIAVTPLPLALGAPVYLCVRPTQILIVRPDRLSERVRENLLHGVIVGEMIQTETYTLHVRLDGSQTTADLEITLPAYVYHRLALDRDKHIMVELRREAVQVIPRRLDE